MLRAATNVSASLLFPIGSLLAGRESTVWLRVAADANPQDARIMTRWRGLETHEAPVGNVPVLASFAEQGTDYDVRIVAPATTGSYSLEFYDSESGVALLTAPVVVIDPVMPVQALNGIAPLSYAWGVDRGVPVHRYQLERFLAAHATDIHGRCLEFQEPRYVPRFGGAAVTELDILHADDSNPRATIVADLTAPNSLESDRFDCIVCTHVLQSIFETQHALAELHRILAPGGVLLVAVPHISMCDTRYGEFWRFTQAGLHRLLTTVFKPEAVAIDAFGNSLTSAGELRGMVAAEFPPAALELNDSRFAAEICARAVKT